MLRRIVTRTALCLPLAFAALALGSCRGDRPTTTKPGDAKGSAAQTMSKRLAAFADEIDPGEQPPLGKGAPPAVAELLGAGGKIDASALEAPLEAWETLPSGATMEARTIAVVALARVLLAAESAQVTDERGELARLRALERLYGFFDLPMFANDRSFFSTLFVQIAKVATSGKGGTTDQARAMELVQYAFDVMKRSGALHRHTAAKLLREHPGDRHIPDVLDRVAVGVAGDDPRLAVELRRAGVDLRGKYVTSSQLLALARSCYVALDLRCGDEQLAAAKAAGAGSDAALAKRITEVETAHTAAVLVTGKPATGVDGQLARAQALVELGRKADSKKAIDELLAAHGDDARVVTLAARHVVTTSFDLEGAYQVIARAPEKLSHRDRAYLEAAIGLRATHFAYEVIPRADGGVAGMLAAIAPEYGQFRADIVAYEQDGAELGKVLLTLLELGEAAAPLADGKHDAELLALARAMLPKGVALVDAAPKSREAYRAALGMALLSADRGLVLQFADRAPPEDATGGLALAHAQLQIAVAVQWGDRKRLADAAREIAALPTTMDGKLRVQAAADLDAVRARLERDTAARDRALQAYRELLAIEGDSPDPRTLDNFAALLADTGDLAEAARLWALLVQKKPDEGEYARIQLHALAGSLADLAALEKIAADGSNEGRIVAAQWLVQLAKSPTERKRRRAQHEKLVAELHARSPKLPLLPDAEGVTLSGTLQVGVGYSTTAGVQVNIDVSRVPRLVRLPAG